jgi:hypothetical protein
MPGFFKSSEDFKAFKAQRAKEERDRIKALTPEERQKEKEEKALAAKYRKADKIAAREQKAYEKRERDNRKRELTILNFMVKTNVFDHHHGRQDSLLSKIKDRIARLKEKGSYTEYDNYGWNWGVTHPGVSLLGCRWSSSEFDSIYNVPLDGSYIFYVYDSGERGSGSRSRITAKKLDDVAKVPYVNPGALIPITAN